MVVVICRRKGLIGLERSGKVSADKASLSTSEVKARKNRMKLKVRIQSLI